METRGIHLIPSINNLGQNSSSNSGDGYIDLSKPNDTFFSFSAGSPSIIRKRKRVCRRSTGRSSSPTPSNFSSTSLAPNSFTVGSSEEVRCTLEVGNAIGFRLDGFEDQVRNMVSNSGVQNIPK